MRSLLLRFKKGKAGERLMLEFFFVCDYIEYIKRNDQEELHEVRYWHLLLRHETPLPCWKIVAWILGQVT